MHGLVVMFSLAVCTVIAVFTSRSGSIEPFFVTENFGPIPEYESGCDNKLLNKKKARETN